MRFLPKRAAVFALATTLVLAVCAQVHAAHFGYRQLEIGCKGEDVEELQWMLKRLGYFEAEIDAHYGRLTEASVKAMQEEYGLPASGRIEGRILEICSLIWSAFVTTEFEACEINPDHLLEEGAPQLFLHTVSKGECLSAIARDYGTRAGLLAKVNRLLNPDLLLVGQELYVLVYR